MQILQTNVNRRSKAFTDNYEHNISLVEILESRHAAIVNGGSERSRKRHIDRGKLLPRDRIALLIDPGSPFLELSALAAYDMYNNESPGAGSISGIGVIQGKECVISANEATIKGGTSYPVTVDKLLRIQEVAATNRLPCVYLVESGGANLPHQAELFVRGGRGFANQARLSAQGIPQIALVFGASAAGGAYVPGLCDYTIFVRNKAFAYLGGPPLVQMATGERTDEESLGGAEMHSRTTGLADYVAEDDADAIRLARLLVGGLAMRKSNPTDKLAPEAPLYEPDDLLGVIPKDTIRHPLEMREVISRIVDGSRFLEFKPNYGPTLVAGHARVNGYQIGIVANNGVLFSESANKATQFIQLCNSSRTPIVYLQNITGFMVGQAAESGGIIKHGSKMIKAVANSSVPQFTILIGGAYGAGYYAMCGRPYDPTLIFAWPSSRTAVMGADQAAGVLGIIQEASIRGRGETPDSSQIDQMKESVRRKFEIESDPYYASARLWDDGIIDPRDTRAALSIGLSMCYNGDWMSKDPPAYGVFRM